MYSHCIAEGIDSNTYLVTGGCSKFECPIKKSTIYSFVDDSWKAAPNLVVGRYAFGCSKYYDSTAAKYKIIVAGGFGLNNVVLDSVAIFDNGKWLNGPKLPQALTGLALTTRNDLPIVLGGLKPDNMMSNKIYQLVDKCWVELGTTLKNPKADAVTLKIPNCFNF